MQPKYYKTKIGIVCKTGTTIRLKSTYTPKDLTETEFAAIEPRLIDKKTYLEQVNEFFAKTPHKREYEGVIFKRLENFQVNEKEISNYNKSEMKIYIIDNIKYRCVMYHNRLVYAHFISPTKTRLLSRNIHEFIGYTHIKNLAPVLNLKTKEMI